MNEITGQDYAHADLNDEDMSHHVFIRCSFREANLRDARFRRSRFVECLFRKADMSHASLEGAHFEQCSFDLADFTAARLEDVFFQTCTGHEMCMEDAQMRRGHLERCHFTGNFRRLHAPEVSIQISSLHGADLSDGDLSKAVISMVNMEQARFCDTCLIDAQATRTSFAEADLRRSWLYDARFVHCDFRRASFREARAARTTFLECDHAVQFSLGRKNESILFLPDLVVVNGRHYNGLHEALSHWEKALQRREPDAGRYIHLLQQIQEATKGERA